MDAFHDVDLHCGFAVIAESIRNALLGRMGDRGNFRGEPGTPRRQGSVRVIAANGASQGRFADRTMTRLRHRRNLQRTMDGLSDRAKDAAFRNSPPVKPVSRQSSESRTLPSEASVCR